MFLVRVCIYTDGDFGYEDPEFQVKDEEEGIFYFKTREDAANALIRSFHNLKKSLRPCGRDNIKRWIDSMDNRVELIARKVPTFIIEKDFGNQSLFYELREVEKVEMENGGYCFNLLSPDINFSWYEEEIIRWDELIKFPDVEKTLSETLH